MDHQLWDPQPGDRVKCVSKHCSLRALTLHVKIGEVYTIDEVNYGGRLLSDGFMLMSQCRFSLKEVVTGHEFPYFRKSDFQLVRAASGIVSDPNEAWDRAMGIM